MERSARLARQDQVAVDGVDRDVDHAGDRPHRGALTQHAEDLSALPGGHLVHARII